MCIVAGGKPPTAVLGLSILYVHCHRVELLSNLVFSKLNQAATWSAVFTSIPSLNFTPLITFAR